MKTLVLFGTLFLVGACSMSKAMTLELDDVQNFSLVEMENENGTISLRISGLAFHSALAVDRMETTVTSETLKIRVLLVPAKKGLSGRFDYVVQVPKGVKRVLFGEKGIQIWPTTGRAHISAGEGEGGAKVGYDGPHPDTPGNFHDQQHISWQSAGKRSAGGERGNVPYSGEQHPSRAGRKED